MHSAVSSTPIPRRHDSICATARWARQGITVAGGNGCGYELNQLNHPMGIFIDEDRTIYIADTNNARIVKWTEGTPYGQIVAGELGAGSGTAQLYGPMDMVVEKAGTIYITGTTNNRVQKWNRNAQRSETIINIQRPIGIALDEEESLYISAFYQSQALVKFRKGEKDGYVIASNLPDLYYLFC
jgi:sugar lactone lactonase YvrE